MLNQFKSYSQTKKSPLQIPRLSVFSSPDEDEDEFDDSHYLEVKGNTTQDLFFKWACSVMGCLKHAVLVDTACFTTCRTSCPVLLVCSCECVSYGGILIACLKFPPQRTKSWPRSSTGWLLSLPKAGQNLRGKLWKTTRTIPCSRKSREYVGESKTSKDTSSITETIRDSILFRFLFEKDSREYLYFRKKVARLRQEDQGSSRPNDGKRTFMFF